MDVFRIHGGAALHGRVRVNGAKNSALKLVAAALLAEGTSTITNVPDIADMHAMRAVLEHLGVDVTTHGSTYRLDVPAEVGCSTPPELVQRLRASIVVLGPLLARCGRVRLAMPGGCNLGSRGIDMHLAGLARLGAQITYGDEHVEASIDGDHLVGADVELPFASVGATENVLMAAVTARGTTRISNAAREPEIRDLSDFLTRMGARISGAGSPEIVVEGVAALSPSEHAVVPDRIEAGTFAVAAALTGGDLEIEGVVPDHLRLPLDKLRAAGAEIDEGPDRMRVTAGRLRAVDVVTLPYPGFPTDLQPQLLVLLSQATGTSMLTENVFDGRFGFVDEFNRMGGRVTIEGHHAVVRGPRRLSGALVRATDLRAGAALVLAGLVADGETLVSDAHHVDRGYADFAGRLRSVGADVERATVDDSVAAAATVA